MPTILYTTDNLVSQVRSMLDELNRDSVDTDTDILPALNRGQVYAFDILTRRYPEPILAYETLTMVGSQEEYDIPKTVFEDRIQKLEVIIPSGSGKATYREIQRISYRDLNLYESASLTNVPLYYAIIGRKMRIIPASSGTYNVRMWYLRNPEALVLPQGRINLLTAASNYVILDSVGSSLTTESDQLGSYVNLVDGQTGEIRGTLQIQILAANKVTFRAAPTRTTVLNRPVSGSLSDLSPAQDDYLAPIEGTCVPYYGQPVSNFLIQFAVAEITRKLGGQADTEEKILDKFEKQVEKTWAGRETQLRIKKRNSNFGVPTRRWFYE